MNIKKKHHSVRIVLNPIRNSQKQRHNQYPWHTYVWSLTLLDCTDISIKSGRIELVLWAQTSLHSHKIRSYASVFLHASKMLTLTYNSEQCGCKEYWDLRKFYFMIFKLGFTDWKFEMFLGWQSSIKNSTSSVSVIWNSHHHRT